MVPVLTSSAARSPSDPSAYNVSPSMVGVERAPGYDGCWSALPTRPIFVDHTVLPSATFSAFTISFCIPSLAMM